MPRYSNSELQAYQNGTGINVNWHDQVLKDHTPYYDADLIFDGGDSTARYNVVLDYVNQKGLFNVSNGDATSNQMLKRYNIRTNLDFNMFNVFEAKIDLGGRIEDTKRPNYSTSQLWTDLTRYPSNIYNIKDGDNWSGTALYPNNPVASLNALGWASSHNRILQGNFALKEKLDFLVPGLYLSQAYSFNSFGSSGYSKTANYARYLNGATTTTDQFSPLRATGQSANGQEDWKQFMATLGYAKQSGDNSFTSALNYHRSNYRGDGLFSFAYHYQNISGRANYSYKNKYVGEFGFSYFGSDAYAPGNRWGFYPAVSAAWVVSNEDFLKGNDLVSLFKIRASVGKTGTADTEGEGIPIAGLNGRFLYQQYYSGSGTFYMGDGNANANGTLSPFFIANKNVFAEESIKYNIGTDLNLFNKLDVTLDFFLDKRSGILTIDNSIPSSYGNNLLIRNLGEQTNKGFEASALFSDKVGSFGYSVTGMASVNKNKIDYMAEITPAFSYNAATGLPFGTYRGLVATGYYQLSDFNADGTLKAGQPVPAFGAVQPGDLKYQNLNPQDDNIINENDITSIGKSHFPQLTFAFGGALNFKSFDVSALFQGVAGSSVNIMNSQTMAFVNNSNAFSIAQDAWAYYPDQNIDTRATAKYPRLTTVTNNNNYRMSSFWIKSGDFLRLRNVEVGYSLSTKNAKRVGLERARLFINANNVATWSSLTKNYDIDPETVNSYPALKSFNAGLSITF
jgi:TonB-linked SusC/RagA family outer membrane protein